MILITSGVLYRVLSHYMPGFSSFDLSVCSKFADALHMPPSEREGDRAYAVEGANGINDL